MSQGIACKHCGCIGSFREEIGPFGPHYGKLFCAECGKFFGFMKKPENEDQRAPNKYNASSLGIDCCQMCGRDESMLGLYESLEVHHVVEIQHGGADKPENIWCVCTQCHKYIHHVRIYNNEHQKHRMTRDCLVGLMDAHKVPESVRGYMLKMLEGYRNG